MIHLHLVVTYRLDHQSALFTPRNDRVYSHYLAMRNCLPIPTAFNA